MGIPASRAPDVAASRKNNNPIKHIIVIVQENRTIDNIFAGFPGADAPTSGYNHKGKLIKLHEITLQQDKGLDIGHNYHQALGDYDDGKMDGFDEDTFNNGKTVHNYPYGYVNPKEVKPYWDMASQYVLADHMFPDVWGPSFTAHLSLIAGTTIIQQSGGTTVSEIDTPYDQNYPNWTCAADPKTPTYILTDDHDNIKWSGGGPAPCFTQFTTMADSLDAKSISWKYYVPAINSPSGELWSAFGAISNIYYGPDWKKDVISPETTILKDIPRGNLPQMSWVVPDDTNSDHTGNGSDTGPSWVAAIVNGVGESKYWDSTAIVVLWDDWGGWYDDVPPPQLDFMGLAERVGCIIISPYAKAHTVVHTQYEYGSILKYIEQVFALPSLGHTDARSTSLSDALDYLQEPIRYKPIAAKYPPKYFLHQKPSYKLPDDE